jgi:anthranilate synthase/aminodeoxychorismate synthase-like glutamine amidotransferase
MDLDVKVVRNDELTVAEAVALRPSCIVVSPGPKRPEEAGISVALVRECSGRIPLLGVCLGHQAIGYAFGGRIVKAKRLMHGKVSEVTHDGEGLFAGIRSPLKATRYHSLAIERATLPECLEVTATAEDGEIMGIRHREHRTVGVQFHPESILTPCGKRLLANFVKMATEVNGRT